MRPCRQNCRAEGVDRVAGAAAAAQLWLVASFGWWLSAASALAVVVDVVARGGDHSGFSPSSSSLFSFPSPWLPLLLSWCGGADEKGEVRI